MVGVAFFASPTYATTPPAENDSATPYISDISPNPASGGTVITITGRNFNQDATLHEKAIDYINFNGDPNAAEIISWTNSAIQARVPIEESNPNTVTDAVGGIPGISEVWSLVIREIIVTPISTGGDTGCEDKGISVVTPAGESNSFTFCQQPDKSHLSTPNSSGSLTDDALRPITTLGSNIYGDFKSLAIDTPLAAFNAALHPISTLEAGLNFLYRNVKSARVAVGQYMAHPPPFIIIHTGKGSLEGSLPSGGTSAQSKLTSNPSERVIPTTPKLQTTQSSLPSSVGVSQQQIKTSVLPNMDKNTALGLLSAVLKQNSMQWYRQQVAAVRPGGYGLNITLASNPAILTALQQQGLITVTLSASESTYGEPLVDFTSAASPYIVKDSSGNISYLVLAKPDAITVSDVALGNSALDGCPVDSCYDVAYSFTSVKTPFEQVFEQYGMGGFTPGPWSIDISPKQMTALVYPKDGCWEVLANGYNEISFPDFQKICP